VGELPRNSHQRDSTLPADLAIPKGCSAFDRQELDPTVGTRSLRETAWTHRQHLNLPFRGKKFRTAAERAYRCCINSQAGMSL